MEVSRGKIGSLFLSSTYKKNTKNMATDGNQKPSWYGRPFPHIMYAPGHEPTGYGKRKTAEKSMLCRMRVLVFFSSRHSNPPSFFIITNHHQLINYSCGKEGQRGGKSSSRRKRRRLRRRWWLWIHLLHLRPWWTPAPAQAATTLLGLDGTCRHWHMVSSAWFSFV